MTQNTPVEKKHISMYPEDWAVVAEVSQTLRLANTSAALRYIIGQYRQEEARGTAVAVATGQEPAAPPTK